MNQRKRAHTTTAELSQTLGPQCERICVCVSLRGFKCVSQCVCVCVCVSSQCLPCVSWCFVFWEQNTVFFVSSLWSPRVPHVISAYSADGCLVESWLGHIEERSLAFALKCVLARPCQKQTIELSHSPNLFPKKPCCGCRGQPGQTRRPARKPCGNGRENRTRFFFALVATCPFSSISWKLLGKGGCDPWAACSSLLCGVAPTSVRNRSQIGSESVRNRSQIRPKSVPNRSQIGSKSVRRPILDQFRTDFGPISDQFKTNLGPNCARHCLAADLERFGCLWVAWGTQGQNETEQVWRCSPQVHTVQCQCQWCGRLLLLCFCLSPERIPSG